MIFANGLKAFMKVFIFHIADFAMVTNKIWLSLEKYSMKAVFIYMSIDHDFMYFPFLTRIYRTLYHAIYLKK